MWDQVHNENFDVENPAKKKVLSISVITIFINFHLNSFLCSLFSPKLPVKTVELNATKAGKKDVVTPAMLPDGWNAMSADSASEYSFRYPQGCQKDRPPRAAI